MRTFEYLYDVKAMGTLDVDNVGNVVISATNLLYQEYFLIIKTEYGRSKIIQYGPVWVEEDIKPNFISYTYTEMDFSSSRLETIIEKFLNNPKYCVSQAKVIDLDEAISRIKDLIEFL